MVIGTASKRTSPFSPRPFGRRCVGEKGIGRFAVDKLGDKVNIVTKKEEDDRWLNVEIDWNSYFNGLLYLTDSCIYPSGTALTRRRKDYPYPGNRSCP